MSITAELISGGFDKSESIIVYVGGNPERMGDIDGKLRSMIITWKTWDESEGDTYLSDCMSDILGKELKLDKRNWAALFHNINAMSDIEFDRFMFAVMGLKRSVKLLVKDIFMNLVFLIENMLLPATNRMK